MISMCMTIETKGGILPSTRNPLMTTAEAKQLQITIEGLIIQPIRPFYQQIFPTLETISKLIIKTDQITATSKPDSSRV